MQANLAHENHSNNHGRGNYQGRNGGFQGHGRAQGGRFQNTGGRTNKIQCQLCGKMDHSAYNCWHRYDQKLADPNQNSHTFVSQNTGQNLVVMQAMNTSTQNLPYDDSWYPDLGAINHLTPDVNNLQQQTE
uniref:Retrovirus-related Pol polyprotein from transposon TNT 1-94 n=1 Tax=Cajanus cajan TaxID=3821 RepID=A0A151S092_CAJCA|nr:hypothetical protein KK1_030129 [Cajanus cajan]